MARFFLSLSALLCFSVPGFSLAQSTPEQRARDVAREFVRDQGTKGCKEIMDACIDRKNGGLGAEMATKCAVFRRCKKACRGDKKQAKKASKATKKDCKALCKGKKGKAKKTCQKSCRGTHKANKKDARQEKRACKGGCVAEFGTNQCFGARKMFWKAVGPCVLRGYGKCWTELGAIFTRKKGRL
jgi:hypothetical protein